MNGLRELICDDIATSTHTEGDELDGRTDYAESLLLMAERSVEREFAAGSLGISLSSISEMERRIKRILNAKASPVELKISKQFLAASIAFSMLMAVGLAFAQIPLPEMPVLAEDQGLQTAKPEFPIHAAETLTLGGAAPLTVQITQNELNLTYFGESLKKNIEYVWHHKFQLVP